MLRFSKLNISRAYNYNPNIILNRKKKVFYFLNSVVGVFGSFLKEIIDLKIGFVLVWIRKRVYSFGLIVRRGMMSWCQCSHGFRRPAVGSITGPNRVELSLDWRFLKKHLFRSVCNWRVWMKLDWFFKHSFKSPNLGKEQIIFKNFTNCHNDSHKK